MSASLENTTVPNANKSEKPREKSAREDYKELVHDFSSSHESV